MPWVGSGSWSEKEAEGLQISGNGIPMLDLVTPSDATRDRSWSG